MKALSIREPGVFEQTEAAEPVCGEKDVLVGIKYVGLCGSDLHSYLGTSPMVRYPVIPGHEICGVILEKGADVPDGYKIGDTVTVLPYFNCGGCYPCSQNRPNCCEHNKTLGVQRDGVMSERFAVSYEHIVPCGELSYELGALIEPFSIGWHAAARARVGKNDRVAVFGCGAVGIGVMAAAHAMGARVLACDISADKLRFIKDFAGFDTLDPTDADAFEAERAAGVHAAIDATGSNKTLNGLLKLVTFAGRAGIVGYADGVTGIESKLIVSKELDFYGSRNADKGDFMHVRDMLLAHEFDYESLITRVFPFEDAMGAFDYWKKERDTTVKLLVRF